MKKIYLVLIVALIFWAVLMTRSLFAAEGGAGHYVPGAIADFMDMAPASGLGLANWYNRYDGSAGGVKPVPIGGFAAANLDVTTNAEMLGAFYTFPFAILDGKFMAGVIIPYVWVDVKGAVTGPGGVTSTRRDTADGIGDIALIPFGLNWMSGDFKWGMQLDVYAPTGEYNVGRLANPGLNYWTFEPMVSLSYMSKKIGLEISTTAGLDFNTKNTATGYQSGDMFHIDTTIAEHLPLFGYGTIGVGANAFYWKQFTGDSGSGAKLGSFETLMAGVGPVVSYISPPIYGHTLVAEVKWLPQIETSNTVNGSYLWFKVGLSF